MCFRAFVAKTDNMKFTLNKIEILKLTGQCIRAGTGIIGGSLVLVEGHPYTATAVLALGAVANEVVSFLKEKENAHAVAEANSESPLEKGGQGDSTQTGEDDQLKS